MSVLCEEVTPNGSLNTDGGTMTKHSYEKDLHILTPPGYRLHPFTLNFCVQASTDKGPGSARRGPLMKTIQVNQVYQKPKASVIWKKIVETPK